MKPRALRTHATSIVLLVLAAGLGVYVFVEHDRPSTDELAARQNNVFPVMRRDEISVITLEREGDKARIERRTDDAGDSLFYLTAGSPPREEIADQVSVERLFQTLEFATRMRGVDPGIGPAATGLQTPRMRISVEMGSRHYTLAVGKETQSPANAAFAQLDDQNPFVLSGDTLRDLLRPLDFYRTRRLVPYLSSELRAFHLDGPEGMRSFVRGPWGGFRIENEPGSPRVDRTAFDQMLTAFAGIEAERFIEQGQADAALQASEARITLRMEPTDGRPDGILEVGGACPNQPNAGDAGAGARLVVAIRRQPTPASACIPQLVVDALRTPRAAFVDRKLIGLRADEVEELQLSRGDQTLDLARHETAWRVRKPVDMLVDSAAGDGFINSLLGKEGSIVSSPDLAKLGLQPPAGSLVIRLPASDDGPRPEHRLDISAPDPAGAVFVRRLQDDVVLQLTASEARMLEPTTTMLRSTQLVDVPATRIHRVETVIDDKRHQVVERTETGFDLVHPKGFEADGSLATDLFTVVAQLTAERWVADRDDPAFGLSQPRMVVRFEQRENDGSQTRKLIVGEQIADGSYARLDDDPGVFVLPLSAERHLRSYALDRSLFMVDPNEVKSVQLQSGERKAAIQSRGGTWTAQPDAGVALSQTSLAKIQQALIEMRAEGTVHLGPPEPEEGFDMPLLRIRVERTEGRGDRSSEVVILIGRGDVWRTMNVYYARRQGVAATYAIAAAKLRPLLDAMARQ